MTSNVLECARMGTVGRYYNYIDVAWVGADIEQVAASVVAGYLISGQLRLM